MDPNDPWVRCNTRTSAPKPLGFSVALLLPYSDGQHAVDKDGNSLLHEDLHTVQPPLYSSPGTPT